MKAGDNNDRPLDMKPARSVPFTDLLPEWLRTPVLPIGIGKELQAIKLYWLLGLFFAVGIAVSGDGDNVPLFAGLLMSSVAMGANCVGHEFAHRTLDALLVQPVTRASLWQRKMRVLAVALATSAAPALLVVVFASGAGDPWGPWLLVAGIILSGWCVAPWLTLLTRSTLAGTVFAAALPALFWLLSLLTASVVVQPDESGWMYYGWFVRVCFVLLLAGHWVAGGVLGYRAFRNLEALDGAGKELHLPQWPREQRGAGRAVTQSPAGWGGGLMRFSRAYLPTLTGLATPPPWLRWVVRKELRLQSPTFLVAGLFIAVWGFVVLVWRLRPETSLGALGLLSPVYLMFIALLAGALACGEERQLGTLQPQLALPVSAWQQWLAKTGVVVGLAVGFGAVLPFALALATPFEGVRQGAFEMTWQEWFLAMTPASVVLAGLALYVSSIGGSTVRALLVSMVVGTVLLSAVTGIMTRSFIQLVVEAYGPIRWSQPLSPTVERVVLSGAVVLIGLAVAGHAFGNYRTGEQRLGRVIVHLGCLLGYAAVLSVGYLAWGFVAKEDANPEGLDPAQFWVQRHPGVQRVPAIWVPGPSGGPMGTNSVLRRYGLMPKGANTNRAQSGAGTNVPAVPPISPAPER